MFLAEGDGRIHDVCLNEHGFVSLTDARTVIEAWWRKYNQEWPMTSLYRLTSCLGRTMRCQIPSATKS